MAWKHREARRKKRAAIARDQKRSRGSGAMSEKHWLTLVSRTTCCARCAGVLRPGREMVFRKVPQEALCVICADADPQISYRPSARWEQARKPQAKRAA